MAWVQARCWGQPCGVFYLERIQTAPKGVNTLLFVMFVCFFFGLGYWFIPNSLVFFAHLLVILYHHSRFNHQTYETHLPLSSPDQRLLHRARTKMVQDHLDTDVGNAVTTRPPLAILHQFGLQREAEILPRSIPWNDDMGAAGDRCRKYLLWETQYSVGTYKGTYEYKASTTIL